jgi:hypothetical protein
MELSIIYFRAFFGVVARLFDREPLRARLEIYQVAQQSS